MTWVSVRRGVGDVHDVGQREEGEGWEGVMTRVAGEEDCRGAQPIRCLEMNVRAGAIHIGCLDAEGGEGGSQRNDL